MNIAICDDNVEFVEQLAQRIKNFCSSKDQDCRITSFTSGNELIENINRYDFDIVILDIDMPDINGKDVACRLRNVSNYQFKLMFISNMQDEVFSTFRYDISSFIPKTELDKYLDRELDRIFRQINNIVSQTITLKFLEDNTVSCKSVRFNDILYIEALKGEIIVHTTKKSYSLVHYQFEQLRAKFLKHGFIDVHRYYTVNPAYIDFFGPDHVILRSKTNDKQFNIPVSRRKKTEVKDKFFKYIKGKVSE